MNMPINDIGFMLLIFSTASVFNLNRLEGIVPILTFKQTHQGGEKSAFLIISNLKTKIV